MINKQQKAGKVSYADAIKLAIEEEMEANEKILVFGLGVDDPTGMYGTTKDLVKKFGPHRCFDTPLSEDSMTGYAIGLALKGYRGIHIHQRADFLLLCANQLINMAAKIKYVSNNKSTAPFIVRGIIGRSWGQGAQHSQSLHSLFANIPGLRVLLPATAQDVYNAYKSALRGNEPTIILEHRMLYKVKSNLERKKTPNVSVIDQGNDLTVVSNSHTTYEAQRAIEKIKELNITIDHFSIIDISNTDTFDIVNSSTKTNRLLIIDNGWLNCSIAHTIGFKIYQSGFKGHCECLGYAPTPCPTAKNQESEYYPDGQKILDKMLQMLGYNSKIKLERSKIIEDFRGPF